MSKYTFSKSKFILLAVVSSFGISDCKKEPSSAGGATTGLPAVQTTSVSSVTQLTAASGGNVTSSGGTDIIARGICWNITPNPTTLNNRTNDGTGSGIFISTLTGLNPSTTYYLRAYATNSVGTSYGNELSFTTSVQTNVGTIYIGGTDSKLYALNLDSGTIKWTFQTGGIIISSPAVIGDLVIVGSGDQYLYAINANTGRLYWKYYTGSFSSAGSAIESTPVVNSRYIYFSCSNGKTYALDTTTYPLGGGIIAPVAKWASTVGSTSISGPTIDNGLVLVGNNFQKFMALDTATGQKKWEYTMDDDSHHSNAAIGNGIVYVYSHNSTLYALNSVNGNLLWKNRLSPIFSGAVYCSPTIWNGNLYVAVSDSNYTKNQVFAVNINSGIIKWKSEAPPEPGTINIGALVYNGNLYGASDNGYLYAWDATLGSLKWKYKTNATSILNTPVALDGLLYFAAMDGTFYAMNADNGILKWQKKITTGSFRIIYSSPCIVDKNGIVYHPGDSGEKQ